MKSPGLAVVSLESMRGPLSYNVQEDSPPGTPLYSGQNKSLAGLDLMSERPHRAFLGTYFDRSLVLRVSRWTIILGWLILAAYLLEFGYTTYQSVSSAII